MLRIQSIKTENRSHGIVTDERQPRFTFALRSDQNGTKLSAAVFRLGRSIHKTDEFMAVYDGPDLLPRTPYIVSVTTTDNHGNSAEGSFR